jgi:hypothetical protein
LLISVSVPPWHVFVWLRRVQKCIHALVFRDRSTLSRPPGIKPQRTSQAWKSTNSCKWLAYIYNITWTLKDIHST